ncbi:MAG: hypothetical protein IPL62_00330 [Caulobacteraceae bacterium]|nr:hypothetical protein [Caulobacteraceae bacterium]
MILVIDNYDSFVYNLVHYVEDFGVRAEVVRNDALTVADVLKKKPKAVILSPGPCTPKEAGICLELLDSPGVDRIRARACDRRQLPGCGGLAMSLAATIGALRDSASVQASDIDGAFAEIMDGAAAHEDIKQFLTLTMPLMGHAPLIAAGARALRSRMVRVNAPGALSMSAAQAATARIR